MIASCDPVHTSCSCRSTTDLSVAWPGSESTICALWEAWNPQSWCAWHGPSRSLRAIYAATEAELAGVVGAVAAARIRWFLDAPLDTRLAVEQDTLTTVALRSAA